MSSEEEKKTTEETPKQEENPAATGGDEADKPAADGAPLVKILDKDELKTAEEDEEIIIKERAKLWRFDNSEWKERGSGDVKLLKHKETTKIRVLMRRDKTLKICANHYVDDSMELKEHSGSARAWIYTAPADFAGGEANAEVFAIRFGDAEIAKKWKVEFDKAREHMKTLKKD
eukprot:CAMPEP_0201515750 /NCGR_PEP_ID=MMETSP0161_2-20130828/7226_1 /ASSEMBLY_ACC=CAM_ASM_000251 /TAXON_ID=180227 /ORGANISM="Neoparamoeba aestuarina, Strain SoJaBio B1-5/56/2" /LENGTH=173 /DNA_ID=CAMNT_0047912663 /DNA_START=55 /DNA_END=576 /DNA_ORIENTATION=+